MCGDGSHIMDAIQFACRHENEVTSSSLSPHDSRLPLCLCVPRRLLPQTPSQGDSTTLLYSRRNFFRSEMYMRSLVSLPSQNVTRAFDEKGFDCSVERRERDFPSIRRTCHTRGGRDDCSQEMYMNASTERKTHSHPEIESSAGCASCDVRLKILMPFSFKPFLWTGKGLSFRDTQDAHIWTTARY